MTKNPSISLDLRSLALQPGQAYERRFAVDLAPFIVGGEKYEALVEDEGVMVFVQRVSGGFLVTVKVDAVIYGPCFRCLAEARMPLSASESEFVPSDTAKWRLEDMSPFIDGHVVDVAGLAAEALILALPEKILCREDCAGLCPQCGLALANGPCGCPPSRGDPRWKTLEDLFPQA